MEKYFIIVDGQQQGPFSKREIIDKHLPVHTHIYSESIGEWKVISEVPTFVEGTGTMPPPIFKPNSVPKTYLTESILVTLFCCLPFGVVGIVQAAKVESLFLAGNYQAAEQTSLNAKKWYKRALWSGVIFFVLYILFLLATTYFFINPNNYNY